jgi:hypothetical protein
MLDLTTGMLWRRQYLRASHFTELSPASTASALERLERVLGKMVLFLEEQGTMGGLVAGTERREGPCNEPGPSRHHAFQTTPWYRWLHDLLAGLLTEAVERAELAALDIPYTADAILAALHPAVYRFQREERGFSSERILQGLRHIYIDGVKTPSAQARRADDPSTVGVPTFFPPKIPAKAPARSRTGLNEAGSPVAWQQRKRYSRPFSLKK